ncbi:MAG: zinc transport system substrate-binding protein [Methanobacterium sp.]|jgi:zinc transport system substrate-binding protein|uniref:metal ABC transporter solute-binding protein, Zn/Mn family n=1 Tax=Methanobacterium sp. TaxID=2164 RepID=UPI0024AC25F2|nr:zinc ABC transporter substrate-binding protein [Methanobacterium sp.]MDI3550055.1 zinc transport system substrate-binding protein [Methanobacterium sp.]
MIERKKILIVIILILLLALSLAVYFHTATSDSTPPISDKIGVVVTVGPQEEFVKRVGGDRVNVTVMVPPGSDPHTYEPLAEQMKQVQNAQIYFQVGSGVEFELTWLDKLRSMNQQMRVVNSSKGIQLIPNTAESEEGSDPHVWVSPKNAKIMVENIYQALVETDPANRDYYTKNKDEYLSELEELDKNITKTMADKNSTTIMVYHPSWAYFCKDYNLHQLAIEKEGKEPTSQDIIQIVDTARKKGIKVIFTSPEFSAANAETIAREIGAQVVPADPLSPNYLENMRKVAEAFANS